jgi:tetratricopeptide (TPR) repeat protein
MATIHQALEQGLGLHRAGRLDEAVRIYRAILSQHPENADALHLLGVATLQRGDAGEAEPLLARAAGLQGGNPDVHFHHANALCILNRYGDTAEAFRRVVALRPDDAAAWFGLGDALGQLRRFEEAADAFRRTVALAPDAHEHQIALGVALRNLGRVTEAEAIYRRVIAAHPGMAEAHANLATALQQQGHIDAALESYRRAFALNPAFFKRILRNLASMGHGRLWLNLDKARRALAGNDG